ncbi:MAG: polyprenyl synthetase family protein, partial [Deltaproteobacteria bacterium]|nr:polyprenyl synthetase family protein [Deltaproteobacteria bacterium]
GRRIGRAYQLADDVRDATGDERILGKPTGRDTALGRPNAVRALGPTQAAARLATLLAEVPGAVPACPGRIELTEFLERLLAKFRT